MKSWRGRAIEVTILYSRAGVAQQIWVSNENGAVLADAGDGLLRDILSSNLPLDQLRAVIFTHGHFDHVDGLHSLLGFLRMTGRKDPLPICAPEGCTEVFSIVDNFLRCYPDTTPFRISCEEVRPHQVLRISGMNIEAYPVVHCGSFEGRGILDPIPALGYRVWYKGEHIAISGDTGTCASLEKLVKGADLAILEATYGRGNEQDEEFLRKVHLSEDLAIAYGKLANEFVLVHRGRREEA